jgi:hypothetical protein
VQGLGVIGVADQDGLVELGRLVEETALVLLETQAQVSVHRQLLRG